jgi:hypothetical protein
MRRTTPWKIRAWLIVALWAGCGQHPRALNAQEGFRAPRINGTRLDWCLVFGEQCGQPAADEFCRHQGFKAALRFEIEHMVSPTQVITSGKRCTIPGCDAFLYIICTNIPQPAERDRGQLRSGPAPQPEKKWKYEVLARDKTIAPGDPLLEFPAIDVRGFRTARLFVQLTPSGSEAQAKVVKDAELRVAGFHPTPSGSQKYFEGTIPAQVPGLISDWIEIPVIGPELRIVISGDKLPELERKATCTLYLLK